MNQLKLQRQAAERLRAGEEYGSIATALGVSRPTVRNAIRLYKDYEHKLRSKKPLERAALSRGRALAEARTDFVDAIEALEPTGRDVQDALDLRRKLFDSNTEPALFNSMVEVINMITLTGGLEKAAELRTALVEAFPVPEPEPEEVPTLPPTEEEYAAQGQACAEGACSPVPWLAGPAEPEAVDATFDLGGEG